MENDKPTLEGRILRIIGLLVTIVAVCAVGLELLVWNFERPPLKEHQMNSVRVGMSRTEVVQLLGSPNHTNDWQWVYTRPLAWGEFKVNFDDNGKVKNCDFDK